jgi:hypothetical protein
MGLRGPITSDSSKRGRKELAQNGPAVVVQQDLRPPDDEPITPEIEHAFNRLVATAKKANVPLLECYSDGFLAIARNQVALRTITDIRERLAVERIISDLREQYGLTLTSQKRLGIKQEKPKVSPTLQLLSAGKR